ncbi:MAG: alpha/beta fold hydrolase [Planctomycetes bacterium]|nr:alpha/beta fold hydrolase [Planctomycetota bacterium]MBL7041447.1 alpha/beta fold hydrolase [Pirellulaceae bacterium]
MTFGRSTWLSSLMLFAGAFSLQAGDLKNPSFEEEGDWQIVRKGENLQAAFDDGASQDGKRCFTVSLPDGTSTNDEDFAGIVQVVELTKADKGISFCVKDNYTGGTTGYHWMELLLDQEVIWEADVAEGDTEWRKVSVDLARYLEEVKLKKVGRNKYEEDRKYAITFRVFERRGVNRFGIQVWADNFTLLKETPANPQNCEKKKTAPSLAELLVYYDEADLIQPITKPEHFESKRQQIIEGMMQGMGKLPDRPKRSSLEDFNIRVINTQVRGRYTKKTIAFDAAEDEVVHAFLYEPLDKNPSEKRPGIVGMHPTGDLGKGCFESWPLCNFLIELAMMGYVVIVPDYPGFGDSRPYDFDADRYDSGTIKGVFNHMTCVDLLQVHPDVDPDKIGTIGHSLGGHNAMFLAAFDDRVKIAVSSCGWTPFEYYETKKGRLKTWAVPRYMPPLETIYKSDHSKFPFDFHEVAAAIAPRVFFSSSPTNDGVFPGWGPKAAAPYITEYYKAHGAEGAFQFHQPRAQHRFPWDTRQKAYRSMNDTFDYHFHGAFGLLAERKGEEAIPVLKRALQDADPKVRWAAADMLGTLGEQSGLEPMKKDLDTFSSDEEDLELALEVAKVLAEMGDTSGYDLAADLAANGATHGQRWRAAVVLAHISNTDKAMLKAAGMDPIAVLKTMAAEEEHEGVFFVFVDQVHKILQDRTDMIDIFAIAKESKHHMEPPPGAKHRIAEIFYLVAVRDKDKSWR